MDYRLKNHVMTTTCPHFQPISCTALWQLERGKREDKNQPKAKRD